MSRPSEYSEALAFEICAQIAEGRPLVRICEHQAMPNTATVYRWMKAHPDFLEMYQLAKEDQADTLAEEIITIADELPHTKVVDSDGTEVIIPIVLDAAAVQRQRLRVEARKWVASKLKPKRYGDRQELVGAGGAPLLPQEPLAGDKPGQPLYEAARRIMFVLNKAVADSPKQQDSNGAENGIEMAGRSATSS